VLLGFIKTKNQMKKPFLTISAMLALSSGIFAQTARVQVIHNSADAAAAQVDVYLNGNLLLDNFAFRKASPFIDAPAGSPITVAIAPPTSTSAAQALATFNYSLEAGKTYVIVANGIVSPAGYSPATPFNLNVFDQGKETAPSGKTNVLVYHGSTDAPTVDVEVPGAGTVVNDITYSKFQGALELNTADYTLNVTDETGNTVVASYQAPLQTLNLGGKGLVVLASGFLNPANNSNGAAFGLYVALPTGGDLVALPASKARVQVIHNSADAAAAQVDVYLNGNLLLDNFAFRKSSPFIDAPAETSVAVAIAPPTSTSAAQALATFNYTLEANKTYVIVANGIVSPSGYSPVKPFNLNVFDQGKETAPAGKTNVLVYHGSTDAPTVDVEVPGAGTVVNDLKYGSFQGALELETDDYTLNITDSTGNVVVASYQAPLETLELDEKGLVVLASGFLNPANNSNGAAFGLFVALPAGGDLVALPTSKARVQVIHNSADAAADTVDVYLNGTKLIDNFAFRTASPFVDAPAETSIAVAIAPSTSASATEALATFNYNLEANNTYVIVANGIVSQSGYNPAKPFNLDVFDNAEEDAETGKTNLLIYHGSTDAPVVDIQIQKPGQAITVVDNLEYKEFAGPIETPTLDEIVNVADESGQTIVAQYSAPLQTLGLSGKSIVVLASGFLNPANNSNGAAFGLYAALSTGGPLVALPLNNPAGFNSIETGLVKTYPNPTEGMVWFELSNDFGTNAQIEVRNIAGQLVHAENIANLPSGKSVSGVDLSNLSAGIYQFSVTSGNVRLVSKLVRK
jgi:hypothetical protein